MHSDSNQGRASVALDDAPGNLGYVWYIEPHLRAPRAYGSVTLVLAKPSCIPDSHAITRVAELEGDSHLAICRPAVAVDSPNRSLTFQFYGNGGTSVAVGSANSEGRLGKIVLGNLAAKDAYECEVAALTLLNPLLSHLAHENGTPLYVWQIHIAPASDVRNFVRVHAPFSAKRHGNRQHVFPEEYQHLGAAYREGLNLLDLSPLFAFLSFYKVVEGGKAVQDRLLSVQIETRERQRVPQTYEDAANWIARYLRTDCPSETAIDKWIPRIARGQKYSWVLEQMRAIRNRVAHGLVDPDDPCKGVSSADDPQLLRDVEQWLPLLRAFASRVLDGSGLKQVPLGMPPELAIQQGSRPSEEPTTGEDMD